VAAGKDAEWELYDLAKDRAEANNLAATQPERVRTMAAAWQKEYDAIVELARK
jgi:arylsulfatase